MSLEALAQLSVNKSVSSRWMDLYRKIHNLFISTELAHTKDVALAFKQIDARITALEANVNAMATQLNASITSLGAIVTAHTHPVATAGGPTNQAGTAAPSPTPAPTPTPPTPSATPAVAYQTTFMKAEDAKLLALGPASAPLMARSTVADIKASTQITMDIGV